jgi:hypothetical protein
MTHEPDPRDRLDEQRGDPPRGLKARIHLSQVASIVLGVGLAVTVGIAVYLSRTGGESDRHATTTQPERGVACPYLRQADQHTLDENIRALRRSIAAAARAGEAALDRSGQVFGRPEEIAIELDYSLAQSRGKVTAKISDLLADARTACRQVSR